MQTPSPAIAVFGATGAIGSEICRWHAERGVRVLAVSRSAPQGPGVPGVERMLWDPAEPDAGLQALAAGSVGGAVWAQGANMNDSIKNFDLAAHDRLYAANVSFILLSLGALLRQGLLARDARLCVVSSIWQDIGRPNKLSYMITKSALAGLVRSLAIDLGADGMLVNAVLPGALDTPMTRANLSPAQIAKLEEMSPLRALPNLSDVCGIVGFLCSAANTGITGQFITADRGFSHAKIL